MRVVRSSKGRKHSKYCPEDGNRYDGIYKVGVIGMHSKSTERVHVLLKCIKMQRKFKGAEKDIKEYIKVLVV